MPVSAAPPAKGIPSSKAECSFPWMPLIVMVIVAVGALAASNYCLANKDDWSWLEKGSFLEDSNIATLYVLGPAVLIEFGLLVYIVCRCCAARKPAPVNPSEDVWAIPHTTTAAAADRTSSAVLTNTTSSSSSSSTSFSTTDSASSSSSSSLSSSTSAAIGSTTTTATDNFMVEIVCPIRITGHQNTNAPLQFSINRQTTFAELLLIMEQKMAKEHAALKRNLITQGIAVVPGMPGGVPLFKDSQGLNADINIDGPYIPEAPCFIVGPPKTPTIIHFWDGCVSDYLDQPIRVVAAGSLPESARPSRPSSSSSIAKKESASNSFVRPIIIHVPGKGYVRHTVTINTTPKEIPLEEALKGMTIKNIVDQIKDQLPLGTVLPPQYQLVAYKGISIMRRFNLNQFAEGIDLAESLMITPLIPSTSPG